MIYHLYFDLDNTLLPTDKLAFLFNQSLNLENVQSEYSKNIRPDTHLQRLLSVIPFHKSIITNAQKNHALLSMDCLGISPFFSNLIDATQFKNMKPHPEPYHLALQSETNSRNHLEPPVSRVFFDDLVENLAYPHRIGWITVLIGKPETYHHPDATYCFPTIYKALQFFIDTLKLRHKV